MTSFRADRVSGSGDVALGFLGELERWLATDTSGSARALRERLLVWLRGAQASQPSLALVHQLAARALDVADAAIAREDTPAQIRQELARTIAAERDDASAAREAVARTAVQLLPSRGSWVATLSHSGIVRSALAEAQRRGLEPRALVGESRPRLEGRALAAEIAAEGVPTWLLADAALPLLVSQARAVWLGADAVTNRGVIHKVGSYALALAAREHSVPVYALAERRKFLPAATPALTIAEMAPEEIWEDPAPGVRPRNVYFELVPLDLLRGIVVEDGVIGASEAATLALERPLPPELAGAPA
jgi:translation initiation factor 2B subunit (eIF-2B alpha/beta/delta family)